MVSAFPLLIPYRNLEERKVRLQHRRTTGISRVSWQSGIDVARARRQSVATCSFRLCRSDGGYPECCAISSILMACGQDSSGWIIITHTAPSFWLWMCALWRSRKTGLRSEFFFTKTTLIICLMGAEDGKLDLLATHDLLYKTFFSSIGLRHLNLGILNPHFIKYSFGAQTTF